MGKLAPFLELFNSFFLSFYHFIETGYCWFIGFLGIRRQFTLVYPLLRCWLHLVLQSKSILLFWCFLVSEFKLKLVVEAWFRTAAAVRAISLQKKLVVFCQSFVCLGSSFIGLSYIRASWWWISEGLFDKLLFWKLREGLVTVFYSLLVYVSII